MTTQQAPPDDAALLLRARSGDSRAIEALYQAYYDAGRRFAISLAGADAADDLTADVWAKVLGLLQAGRGPQDNFRAYLFTSIRNRFYDKMRIAGRERPVSDEPWLLDDITAPSDEILEEYDDDLAVAALQSLPERWQKMLWQLEVEGRSVNEVAGLHDIDTAAVSSAAYRAREGLRVAYLDQQINGHMHAEDRECAWVRKRMSKFVRATASARAAERIETHAQTCEECSEILVALQSTNQKFGLLLLPILLVGVSGTKIAAWWGAGVTGAAALLWDKIWNGVRTPAGAVVTAATVLALAGPGAIWATHNGNPGSPPAAPETAETAPAAEPALDADTGVEATATEDQPVDEPVDEPAETPADVDGVAPDATPPAADPAVTRPVDETVDEPVDEPVDGTAADATDQPAEGADEPPTVPEQRMSDTGRDRGEPGRTRNDLPANADPRAGERAPKRQAR